MNQGTFGCHQHPDKIGILIAQLGTPSAPTTAALKPFLKQFLSDPRVIETNRVLWWLILHLIILRRRPARSAQLYQRIWTEEGSPLMLYTSQITAQLQERFAKVSANIEVTFGMRYGTPSLNEAIDALLDKGCTKIALLPMFPQYSATTTGSIYDAVFPHLRARRWVPTLHVVEPFYAHPQYLHAQAQVINESLAKLETPPQRLILSYHGIPAAYVEDGDPYCCMCTETTTHLRPLLNLPPDAVIQTFQSRFGDDPWLQPYTDEMIANLGKQGIKRIAVACPGFLADCLETLDEIGNEARETFVEAGGETLHLIPCLNAHPRWLDGLFGLLHQEITPWLATHKRRAAARCTTNCNAFP